MTDKEKSLLKLIEELSRFPTKRDRKEYPIVLFTQFVMIRQWQDFPHLFESAPWVLHGEKELKQIFTNYCLN